ncbi:ataxin-7-like protein 3 isoform X3 [Bombina bombina]|uniref:ataxin-7-like protein 3 isoform X3 n=1 Tax=Bombina bombina TaxID=8345 RepID=UPI00235A7339|nr:ataxin-7-like protein 3 isoform X3 [Bombina bombina]
MVLVRLFAHFTFSLGHSLVCIISCALSFFIPTCGIFITFALSRFLWVQTVSHPLAILSSPPFFFFLCLFANLLMNFLSLMCSYSLLFSFTHALFLLSTYAQFPLPYLYLMFIFPHLHCSPCLTLLLPVSFTYFLYFPHICCCFVFCIPLPLACIFIHILSFHVLVGGGFLAFALSPLCLRWCTLTVMSPPCFIVFFCSSSPALTFFVLSLYCVWHSSLLFLPSPSPTVLAKKRKSEKNPNSPRRSKSIKHKNGEISMNSDPFKQCGVISEHTKKMCTRSLRCPQHTDDQRRSVRIYLLGPSAHQ